MACIGKKLWRSKPGCLLGDKVAVVGKDKQRNGWICPDKPTQERNELAGCIPCNADYTPEKNDVIAVDGWVYNEMRSGCINNNIIIPINMTKSVADTIRAFQIQNKFRNATEIRNPILLSAQGTIPDWLNGVLYRVGKYNNRHEMLVDPDD